MDAYKVILPKALDAGLSPVQAKEMVYQSFDYLGMGRAWPVSEITNKTLGERGGAGRCPSGDDHLLLSGGPGRV